MSEPVNGPFKNYYGIALAHEYAAKLCAAYPDFAADAFIAEIAPQIEPLELVGRVRLIAAGLRTHLPTAYPEALERLLAILGDGLPDDGGMFNAGSWVYPIATFIEVYGLDDFDASVRGLYEVTKRFTSEFAIRPYLVRYTDRMLVHLHRWAEDPNPHVRRLVSEGSRPRLPWGKRLEMFIADPSPTLALLEKLKDDPSAYVRKSVANHLNDIAKDHPARVVETAARWYRDGNDERRWIVRHGLRTLIKAGDRDALAILGYAASDDVRARLALSPTHVSLPSVVTLTATVHNESSEAVEVVVDYCIHFVRANGGTGGKVFKWTAVTLAPGETRTLVKRHPLRPVTTRTLYSGLHRVELQVNGARLAEAAFELMPHVGES
jgi:3-methyladenine DNA glycosylase AlkC